MSSAVATRCETAVAVATRIAERFGGTLLKGGDVQFKFGYLVLMELEENIKATVVVDSIMIYPAFRRLGHASRIMRQVIRASHALGADVSLLCCPFEDRPITATTLHDWYLRLGFRVDARLPSAPHLILIHRRPRSLCPLTPFL